MTGRASTDPQLARREPPLIRKTPLETRAVRRHQLGSCIPASSLRPLIFLQHRKLGPLEFRLVQDALVPQHCQVSQPVDQISTFTFGRAALVVLHAPAPKLRFDRKPTVRYLTTALALPRHEGVEIAIGFVQAV